MLLFVDRLNIVAGHYRDKFEGLNFSISHSTDFYELERVTEGFGTKVTPHFSTIENTFYRDQAFWIGLWRDGECCATVAYCRQPLGTEPLASFVGRYWKRVYQSGSTESIKLASHQKRKLESITGNLIYSGEIEVLEELRSQGIGRLIAYYGRVMAFLSWPDTDCFYIFTEKSSAHKNLLINTGMTFQTEYALNWVRHPSQAKTDYYLAGMHRSDFLDWLEGKAESLCQQQLKE